MNPWLEVHRSCRWFPRVIRQVQVVRQPRHPRVLLSGIQHKRLDSRQNLAGMTMGEERGYQMYPGLF